jgi:hypothetical protein
VSIATRTFVDGHHVAALFVEFCLDKSWRTSTNWITTSPNATSRWTSTCALLPVSSSCSHGLPFSSLSCPPGSQAEVIAQLRHEDVVGFGVENAPRLAAEIELAERLEVVTLLRPHQEEDRAREILPTQHRIPTQ